MKVLNILYRVMPSGAEKMLADAAEAFKAAGVEGWILANDEAEGEYAPVLREKGYKIVRIPWRNNRLHLIEFWKLCRREKFDAVHIHVIRGYTSFTIVAKLAGVKAVVKTFHGIFAARDPLRWLVHSGKRLIARMFGAKMVAISRSVQENERIIFRNKCRLVWNFTDETGFPLADDHIGRNMRHELGIPEDSFVLLTVGNCHSESHYKIKNHLLLINAIACLPKEVKKRIIYLHVGAEHEGYPERKLAEELGVMPQIRFLGSRHDVYNLLCAANVYVMSSLHEGLGISTIEAAFTGRKMILTNVQGLRDFGEVIKEGITYCDLTPESMARAIQEKIRLSRQHPPSTSILSGVPSIRDDALSTFSMKAGVAELVRLYQG